MSSTEFKILGFTENDENVEPIEIPDDSVFSSWRNDDLIRGRILCGLAKKNMGELSRVQNLLDRKNKSAPKTKASLQNEIALLEEKIQAEERKSHEFANEMSEVKETSVEKSDNIQKEINKLKRFCEHFCSRSFMDQYNFERELSQLQLDLKMEQDMGAFLNTRLAVAKEQKKKLLQSL